MNLSLEVYDGNDQQWIVKDARGLKWSSHYSGEGSGFGYLKFSLPRETGHDYSDIGFGYGVILRKFLNTILFHGQIRGINETSSPDGDKIDITCLGDVVVAGDDELLRAYCDTRLNEWKVESEIPKGAWRPDLYTTGTSAVGLYLHANAQTAIESGQHTELQYEFFTGEIAKRFKCNLSMQLGNGTVFDAQVDAIDDVNGFVDYKNDSGEGQVGQNMYLYNSTRIAGATISAIDAGTNRITVTESAAIAGWEADDEIYVFGPLFSAAIDGIVAAVITYSGTIIGESNLANGQTLCNLSKKIVATIQAFNAGANTITVTNEDHIDGWDKDDIIVVCAPYFEATFDSNAGVTITYSSPIGERVASAAVGWVLHNVTEDEYATVDSWDAGNNKLDVTDVGDITGNWTSSDVLRIYTPFRVKIFRYETSETLIWPVTDWREGAVPHDRTSINITTAGSPTQFRIRYECYITGTANEYSFASLTGVKVYSTVDDINAAMLAKEVVSLLSAAGHDLDSSEDDIEAITKTLEPMVFEFESPADAMTWACKYGDGSGNLLAWGIRLDDRKRVFLETQQRDTTNYVVRRTASVQASAEASVQESAQQVRAIYTDKLGKQRITAWQSDSAAYFAGHYRRRSVRLDNVDTSSEAIELAQLARDENKAPKRSAKYTAHDGSIFTSSGVLVPFDEVKAAGDIVMIEDWRAVETGVSGTDIRDNFTKEQLVGVEVDYDAGTAHLIPAGAVSQFQTYMAELSRLAEM